MPPSRRSSVATTRGSASISTAPVPAPPAMRALAQWPEGGRMETKANYVLIGAFTLAISIFGLLFALWAANWSSEREWNTYRIVFNEAVTGLFEGGSVRYNGINVGSIEHLRLAPNDPRKVVAQ